MIWWWLAADGCLVAYFEGDVDGGLIAYQLHNADGLNEMNDSFTFEILDSRPNTVSGNQFSIHWSRLQFLSADVINVTEATKLVEVSVERQGSLSQVSPLVQLTLTPLIHTLTSFTRKLLIPIADVCSELLSHRWTQRQPSKRCHCPH